MNRPFQIETIEDSEKIEQILLLFDSSFPRPISERKGNLKDYALKLAERAVVDIISIEGKIAGFVAYYCNDLSSKCAFLTQIAVADDCKRQHVAHTLLEYCIEKSKQKGMEKLICEVDEDNADSLKFFFTHGFVFSKKASDSSFYVKKI